MHDLAQRIVAVGAEMSAAAAAAAAAAEAEETEHETTSAAAAAGDFDLAMMGSPAGLGAVGSEDEMEDSIEALRAASLGSQEGVLDGCEDGLLGGDTEPLSDSSRGGGLGGWEGQLLDLLERFAKLPAAALGGMQGAGAALAGGVDGLMGWIRESLVMLLEGVRCGSQNALLAIQGSLGKVMSGLVLQKGGGLDWTQIITSAACAVMLVGLVYSYKENGKLRTMLRRRDHELSKLVMRVVCLQELLHQQRSLAMTRYSSSIATAHSFL